MYEKFGQFIDGKWQQAEKKETYDVINPATEEVIGKASKASSIENSAAIAGNTNVTVTTVASATGGAEPESISSIKFAAPLDYASQGRCVTTDDYVVYTKKFFAVNFPNFLRYLLTSFELI